MRAEKTTITDDMRERLNASPYIFVTNYGGLKVAQFSELRNRLANVGAQCKVVKNTFIRIAAEQVGLPDFSAHLTGQTAIIMGDSDVAAAAKALKTFVAEFKKPEIRMGVIDNNIVTAAQVEAIADLPSLDVLRATLLGLLLSPATKLVRTLNEPGASLARLLQAKIDKIQAEAGAPAEEAAAEEAAPAAAEA